MGTPASFRSNHAEMESILDVSNRFETYFFTVYYFQWETTYVGCQFEFSGAQHYVAHCKYTVKVCFPFQRGYTGGVLALKLKL